MVLMGVLGWLQRRNVLKRSVCRFTAECINTIPKGKVASPWDLNVQIKSCAVLQNETGIHDRRQSASEENFTPWAQEKAYRRVTCHGSNLFKQKQGRGGWVVSSEEEVNECKRMNESLNAMRSITEPNNTKQPR